MDFFSAPWFTLGLLLGCGVMYMVDLLWWRPHIQKLEAGKLEQDRKIAAYRDEAQQQQQSANRIAQTLDAVERERNEQMVRLRALSIEREELMERIKMNGARMATMEKSLGNTREKLETSADEQSTAEAELTNARRRLRTLSDKLAEEQKELRILRSEKQTLLGKLSDAERMLAKRNEQLLPQNILETQLIGTGAIEVRIQSLEAALEEARNTNRMLNGRLASYEHQLVNPGQQLNPSAQSRRRPNANTGESA